MGEKKITDIDEYTARVLKAYPFLVAALQPFAALSWDNDSRFGNVVICQRGEKSLTFGDLHRAKLALEMIEVYNASNSDR